MSWWHRTPTGSTRPARRRRRAIRQGGSRCSSCPRVRGQAAAGRFSGDAFTRARGYEGRGEGRGNVIVPLSFYGPGDAFDDGARAWRRADEWMTFLRARLPRALTFLYMPDEPRQPEYP